MSIETPFAVVLELLESCGWTLTRIYHPYRIFIKPRRLPIWVPVHNMKVEAVYVEKIQRILEAESQEE